MAKGKQIHQERQAMLNRVAKVIVKRCKSKCELCHASGSLHLMEVPPISKGDVDAQNCIMVCNTCNQQINHDHDDKLNAHHWMCLHESIWSELPVVQVMSWRMLRRLSKHHAWAGEVLDQAYLAEDVLTWAQS